MPEARGRVLIASRFAAVIQNIGAFTLMPDGVVVMRVKNERVSELAGLLYKKGRKPVPTELLSR